jgi:hypothetical protein
MSYDRRQSLLEEVQLILLWDRWWGDRDDQDGLRARHVRLKEIARELSAGERRTPKSCC